MIENIAPPRRPGRPPKIAGRPFQPISVSLPPEDIQRLELAALTLAQPSISAVVRLAVADYLRRQDKRRGV